ncbi:hypothetical protein PV08_10357 [Exophiala spinifera]|uniref:Zn(2)-C6 fungal-type domain-containing protein n=1 Tax=Exophiala spinifera TaxID=91928 RepID=A0A0D2AWJ0_9EURO|nr:uncharacterized protein PV08_10357 [Exophiala spinifera]KIW11058.1 hypothetical protein PV08_10357 [Exophiala spinifera]
MVSSSVNGGDDVQPNPRKRRRPPISCQECRRRKVKCNRAEPCGHCVLSKKQCHYGLGSAQDRRIVHDRAPSGRIVNDRTFVPYATPTQATASAIGPSPASDATRLSGHVLAAQPPVEHSCGIARCAYSGETTNVTPDNVTNVPPGARMSLNKSRLFGKSHWTNSTLDFQRTAAVLDTESGNAPENESLARLKWEIGSLLQKCKLRSNKIKSCQLSRCRFYAQANLSVAKDIADEMVHLYTTRFESVFRILHVPSFWNEYELYWSEPLVARTVLKLKIQLVTAIGIAIRQAPIDVPDVYTMARQWLYAAQEWLSGPMKKNRISIESLQLQCLLILARQALAIGGDIVWISMGTVVRTAMQMGLHRDPKHFKKMGILEGEIRRRLWATILELNIQAALDAGVPPTISSNDFDTEAPSDINDKDIDEETLALQEHAATAPTDSSLQRFLLQSLGARLEVARRMNDITSAMPEMSYDELVTLTTSITNACRNCSTHILRTISPDIAAFHSNFADLLLRRFILHLHRPLAGRARSDALYYFSRKMSLDAALAILDPLPKNAEFMHLVLLGSGMFKNRMIHASLAVALELLLDVQEQVLVVSSQEPSGYRKMLMEALREGLRQSAERIRLGETNVKLHMKLAMAMRQVEVTGGENSSSSTTQLAQSAKESLESSYATIVRRAADEGDVDVEDRGNGGGSLEDFEPDGFDPEVFSIGSGFNLDDLFLIPADLDMTIDGTAAPTLV